MAEEQFVESDTIGFGAPRKRRGPARLAVNEDPGYVEMSVIRTPLGAGQIRPDAEEYDPFVDIDWTTLGELEDWGEQLDATIAACDRR
ncbi:hypothetical protein [Nocardioides massiliensis]|uniref:Uncharacterized protein n=1 Tax=Nocardioides massiliensis TaxID=1325935 RepID=A0ABT9NT79_9ACTN|nr:hypothetical protein [Nocardioides massiliensis]MDP9823055.1 hypothetical protein [Nocardioides massiliensis]